MNSRLIIKVVVDNAIPQSCPFFGDFFDSFGVLRSGKRLVKMGKQKIF